MKKYLLGIENFSKNYLCGYDIVIRKYAILADFERTFLCEKVAYYNSWLYICIIK